MEARRAAAGGPDRVPDPAYGAGQLDLPTAARLAGRRLGSRDPVGARLAEDRHMASPRLIPVALRAAPVVTLAVLLGWAISDVSAIADGRWIVALVAILGLGAAALTVSFVFHWRGIRAIGLIAIGAGYVAAHALVLGVQLVPALVFLSVLISQFVLRILAARFSAFYEAGLCLDVWTRVLYALDRVILRRIIASVMSFVLPF